MQKTHAYGPSPLLFATLLASVACGGVPAAPASAPDSAGMQSEISATADVASDTQTDAAMVLTDASTSPELDGTAVDLAKPEDADGAAAAEDALDCTGGVQKGCPCNPLKDKECCSDVWIGVGFVCDNKPGSKPPVSVWSEIDCPCMSAAKCPDSGPTPYCKW